MSDDATFNELDHANSAGWATYHPQRRGLRRWRLRCWLGRHVLPGKPSPANGYSPSNYTRCVRCHAFLKWYVIGQHRWGGIDAPGVMATGDNP